MRIGDHHRVFHGFSCGNGHLLGRLPTKESVKRQRVVRVGHPAPRGRRAVKGGWGTGTGAVGILGRGTVIATETSRSGWALQRFTLT
uniref:Uncharacterized protein n=1 Tax=Panthera leo TaxID=9689 RepID=A0A8C8Y1I0_PANLE